MIMVIITVIVMKLGDIIRPRAHGHCTLYYVVKERLQQPRRRWRKRQRILKTILAAKASTEDP